MFYRIFKAQKQKERTNDIVDEKPKTDRAHFHCRFTTYFVCARRRKINNYLYFQYEIINKMESRSMYLIYHTAYLRNVQINVQIIHIEYTRERLIISYNLGIQ